MINGFLILDKEKGVTSAKSVAKVKHLLYEIGEKNTKIGHFGTLDPDGEGVLPIALGRATRLFDYQENKQKVYYTEFQFGILTDTLDSSGKILECNDNIPMIEEVKSISEKMLGTQLQMPPQYSAKSVNGQRAYDLARKGISVDLRPKEIEIFSFNNLNQIDTNVFSMEITVSSGTYIRAIARDMGEKLRTFCTMRYIKRLQNGVFCIGNSLKTSELSTENFVQSVLPMQYFLQDFETVVVPADLEFILLTGSKLYGLTLPSENFCVYCNNRLIGIGERTKDKLLRIKTWLI